MPDKTNPTPSRLPRSIQPETTHVLSSIRDVLRGPSVSNFRDLAPRRDRPKFPDLFCRHRPTTPALAKLDPKPTPEPDPLAASDAVLAEHGLAEDAPVSHLPASRCNPLPQRVDMRPQAGTCRTLESA